MWFLECPKTNVLPASVSAWIISPSLFPFCLFLFYTLGGDSGVTDQSRRWLRLVFALRLHLCFRVTVFNSIYAQPFITIPRSAGIKSHFSAAEAVIPCCQSPLYCRSCICSSLVFFYWVGAAGAWTGTIMLPHKLAEQHFPTHESMFFFMPKVSRGWINMFISLAMDLKGFCQPSPPVCLVTYSCKNDEQIIYCTLRTGLARVFFVFAWSYFCLGQTLCLQKVVNQNTSFKRDKMIEQFIYPYSVMWYIDI